VALEGNEKVDRRDTYKLKVTDETGYARHAWVEILEAAHERNRHKFLPLETLRDIAGKTDAPLSRVYSVATSYALFNLQPQGENSICVCRVRRAIRAARASYCRVPASSWDWVLRAEKTTAQSPQDPADDARLAVHGSHSGVRWTMRCGASC